jgi:hypothetical protein
MNRYRQQMRFRRISRKKLVNQNAAIKIFNITNSNITTAFIPLSLRRQVLHDQLLLNLPRAGRQQG